jgi:hypothetical protein
MLKSGMTLRATAKVAGCSHGSVTLEKSIMKQEEQTVRKANRLKAQAEAQSQLEILDETMRW